jgi:hypothetical protein
MRLCLLRTSDDVGRASLYGEVIFGARRRPLQGRSCRELSSGVRANRERRDDRKLREWIFDPSFMHVGSED